MWNLYDLAEGSVYLLNLNEIGMKENAMILDGNGVYWDMKTA